MTAETDKNRGFFMLDYFWPTIDILADTDMYIWVYQLYPDAYCIQYTTFISNISLQNL